MTVCTEPIWVIMPILGARQFTDAAISDVLAQTVPTRLLLINQGVEPEFRSHLERIAEEEPERIFLWSHEPRLPSLSATWNRALEMVWAVGGTEALVVNNDVRLDERTCSILQAVLTWPKQEALFVSAVGVTAAQFADRPDPLFDLPSGDLTIPEYERVYAGLSKGGPDFSCFLLSREGHEKYPFDPGFVPAFCEDLDMHRRYMLGGDGERIFSINLPFIHYSSQTRKTLSDEKRAALDRQIDAGARAHYAKKWGGPVNGERYTIPFDAASDQPGVTTPELQRAILGTADVL